MPRAAPAIPRPSTAYPESSAGVTGGVLGRMKRSVMAMADAAAGPANELAELVRRDEAQRRVDGAGPNDDHVAVASDLALIGTLSRHIEKLKPRTERLQRDAAGAGQAYQETAAKYAGARLALVEAERKGSTLVMVDIRRRLDELCLD
jgi:hypothetical protein